MDCVRARRGIAGDEGGINRWLSLFQIKVVNILSVSTDFDL